MRLSPRAIGMAVVTVTIWSSFIVIARALAAHTLLPMDIGLLRILGAALLLLPWGLWLTHRYRHRVASSLAGLPPLPLRQTVQAGFFGGLLYAVLCYAGFFMHRQHMPPC